MKLVARVHAVSAASLSGRDGRSKMRNETRSPVAVDRPDVDKTSATPFWNVVVVRPTRRDAAFARCTSSESGWFVSPRIVHGSRGLKSVTRPRKTRRKKAGHGKNNVSQTSLTGDENKDCTGAVARGLVRRLKRRDGRTDKSRRRAESPAAIVEARQKS